MNDKMQVLFVKQTGHLVAAFTRSADPEGNAGVQSLAGTGVLVRNVQKRLPAASGGESLLVDASSLDVAVVDFRSDVFPAPIQFTAGGGAVARLGTGTSATLSIGTFNTDAITIQLSAMPNENVKVWAQIEQLTPGMPLERRVVQGEIDKTQTGVTLRLTTSLGGPQASLPNKNTCNILVLVAGYPPIFSTQSPT